MGRTQSKSRFSKLSKRLRAYGGTAAAGTPEGEYLNYIKGINKINVTRRPAQEYLERFTVGIMPFGIDFTNIPAPGYADKWAAFMTVFSSLGMAEVGLTPVNLAYEENTQDYSEKLGFFPAMLRWRTTVISATPTTETSGITKKTYKRKPNQNFQIPFGRTQSASILPNGSTLTIATVTENIVGDRLASLVKSVALSGKKVTSVSIVPEEIKDETGATSRSGTTLSGLPTVVP